MTDNDVKNLRKKTRWLRPWRGDVMVASEAGATFGVADSGEPDRMAYMTVVDVEDALAIMVVLAEFVAKNRASGAREGAFDYELVELRSVGGGGDYSIKVENRGSRDDGGSTQWLRVSEGVLTVLKAVAGRI